MNCVIALRNWRRLLMNNNDERIELKRLHVASIFVSFLQTLRAAIVPLIFGLCLRSSREPICFFRFEYILIGIFNFIIISGIAKWISIKYRIRDGDLYVQQGIFINNKRYIQEQR